MPLEQAAKIVERADLPQLVHELKKGGKTVATLNGSFDLFHAGHLYILEEAKGQADVLIVALNTDRSIQGYKGKNRPIIPLIYRQKLLSALVMVDFVTSFDEVDPRALLREIRPDVHVNGAEYGENCIESAVVKEIGARLHLVPRISGLATSHIIEKIKSCG